MISFVIAYVHTEKLTPSVQRIKCLQVGVCDVDRNRRSDPAVTEEEKDRRLLRVVNFMTDRSDRPLAAAPSLPCGGGRCRWW